MATWEGKGVSHSAAVRIAIGSMPGQGGAGGSWLLNLLLTPCWGSPGPSPQVLESCMKSCGKRFHDEVGKFRFLNELIKVVSPKVGLTTSCWRGLKPGGRRALGRSGG